MLWFGILLGIVVASITVFAQLGSPSSGSLPRDRKTSNRLTLGCVILLAAGVAALVWAVRTFGFR